MIYQDVWASLLRLCRIINNDNSLGATVYDFEAHAITEELPNSHLIGPNSLGMSLTTVEDVVFSLGFSSYGEDTALFHHRKGISLLYEALCPEKQIPLFNLETNLQIGNMLLTDDTMIQPMSRAVARPLQFVHARALVTLD